MVSVRGFAATPYGSLPTGIVAVTVVAAVTAWAVLPAEGADAAAVAVMAAGASTAMATVIMVMARWGHFMTSCFLAGRASGVPGHRPALGVIPYVQTPGRAGWLRRLLRDASRSSSCGSGRAPAWSICRSWHQRPRPTCGFRLSDVMLDARLSDMVAMTSDCVRGGEDKAAAGS